VRGATCALRLCRERAAAGAPSASSSAPTSSASVLYCWPNCAIWFMVMPGHTRTPHPRRSAKALSHSFSLCRRLHRTAQHWPRCCWCAGRACSAGRACRRMGRWVKYYPRRNSASSNYPPTFPPSLTTARGRRTTGGTLRSPSGTVSRRNCARVRASASPSQHPH
jgi:hypothetical protein